MVIRTIPLVSFIFLMLLLATAQAKDLVVVAGTVPKLKLGQIVKASTSLDIPEGKSVTLASESGKMVRIKGPHNGPSGMADDGIKEPSLITALSRLLSGPVGKKTAIGAMRSGRGLAHSDPWVIDTGNREKIYCIQEGGQTLFWRSNHAKTTMLTLESLKEKNKVVVVWPRSTRTLTWPPKIPLLDGAEYRSHLKGKRRKKKFVLHLVPSGLPTNAHRAVWMARKGCVAQAKRLLAWGKH